MPRLELFTCWWKFRLCSIITGRAKGFYGISRLTRIQPIQQKRAEFTTSVLVPLDRGRYCCHRRLRRLGIALYYRTSYALHRKLRAGK
jgi:hypothetical protein